MDSVTAKKKFCSPLHRVYFNREKLLSKVEIIIYTLCNPLNNTIFYVGRTTGKLETRLLGHLNDCNTFSSLKNTVIKDILKASLIPVIEEIETVVVKGEKEEMIVNHLEEYWIHQFKEWGHPITNVEGLIRPHSKAPLIKWGKLPHVTENKAQQAPENKKTSKDTKKEEGAANGAENASEIDRNDIEEQIKAIQAEKIPDIRNTPFGKKSWQFDQQKRIEELKKKLS